MKKLSSVVLWAILMALVTVAPQFSSAAQASTVPTISSLAPSSGPIAGGTSVVITGTGFSDATAVSFGTTPASVFNVNSPTQITATSPAGTSGSAQVVVTNGTGPSVSAVNYTFAPVPTVSSISPSSGSTTGSTTVTVNGTGFYGGGSAAAVTGVTVGGAAATSVTVSSDTQLTAVTPSGTAGAQNLIVTTAGGSSGAVSFTYEAPSRNAAVVSTPTKVSPTIARITWTAPSVPGGSSYSISSYSVDYKETSASTWSTFQSGRLASLPLRSTITGLSAGLTYEFRVRTIFSDSVESVSAASSAVTMDAACTLPGARSAFKNLNDANPSLGRELYLGGNFIELGLSSLGNFGTSTSKPAGFTGSTSSSIGMTVDYDGFGCGQALSIDFFLPGSPEERWAVGYQSSAGTSRIGLSKLSSVSGSGFDSTASQIEQDTTIEDQSTSSVLKATVTTVLKSSSTPVMEVKQQISFGVNDQYFTNTVTLKNLSSTSWTSVRYMRSFDPDNLVFRGGDYTTTNEVIARISPDGKAVVRAQATNADFTSTTVPTTYDTRAPILFYSSDSSAVASTFGFSNSNPYEASAYTSPVLGPLDVDGAITITFDKGALAAGSSASLTYITSLDQRDFDVLATEIAAVEAQAVVEASTPTPPVSSGGSSSSPTVAPAITPIVPQRPRQIVLPPQGPVQAPVLQNNQPPVPPTTPQALLNGVPTQLQTLVTDPNNLNLRTGVLNIGMNVRSDQGLVRQGTNGETEVQVRKGGVAGFQGTGLAPRSFVQVFMPLQGTNSKELARIPVDETGSFNGEAVFQTSFQEAPLPIGRQVLQMVTVDEQGRQNVVEITVNIVQPQPAPELNRQDGTTPQLRPGQSLATNAGVPEVVEVTVIEDQKQTVIEGDGWAMSIAPEDENSNVIQNEDGEVFLELVRDEAAAVSGTGFLPGTRADIWLFSEPTLLGTVDIDENGEFNGTVEIDGQMVNVGEHTLQMQGVGKDGYVRAANLGVVVNDADAASTEEAAGSFLWWWLLFLLLIAIAVGAYLWWRKRQLEATG